MSGEVEEIRSNAHSTHHTHHTAAVSSCFLDTECLAAALENSLLGFDLCLEHNLNPAADSRGH